MFISLGTGCNFDREQNWSSTPVTLCTDNASCGDGDSCTINTCGIDGKCTSAPSPSCSSKSIVGIDMEVVQVTSTVNLVSVVG